ncbi:MarR family transcriptional regulator [Methanobrevibacter sp.]
MKDNELYELLGFVKISTYRTLTLKTIANTLKMPSEIAKENNTRTSQISTALLDLKKKKLVICVNENARKGRLYKCTDLGLKILKYLD